MNISPEWTALGREGMKTVPLSREDYCRTRRQIFYLKTDLRVPDALLQGLRNRTDADLGLTPQHLLAAARCGLGTPVAALERCGHQGTFHRLFRLVTPGGQGFILRANAIADILPDYALESEAWASDHARARGIPVPQVVWVDTSRTICPFEYMISSEAQEGTLRDFDDDEAAMGHLLRDLGERVRQIHKLPVSGFGPLDVRSLAQADEPGEEPAARGLFDEWQTYLALNLDEHIETCTDIGAIDPADAQQIQVLFSCHLGRCAPGAPRLLHGDLGNHNILTTGRKVTGFLDWEDCLAGDPCYDIAFWATFHPERRHRAFLDGYSGETALPEDFAVRFWLYFLRVSLAKTVHRHRFGYVDRPGRSPAAGRIKLACERLHAAAEGHVDTAGGSA
jgi:aminoglycoside phosphotransferase (APT) family kinase protein